MALTKIETGDLTGKGVQGQPDVPGLSAADMQTKVEEIVRDVVIPKFNANAENTYDKTEVDANIDQKMQAIGAGDMAKTVYDPANGAKQVAFADSVLDTDTYQGSVSGVVKDSDKLGGLTKAELLAQCEPAIATKHTAFNVDYGTTAGTVCQGNDARLSNARRASNITMSYASSTLSITYS